MITYREIGWSEFYPQCVPLWREHYEEFWQSHQGKMAMAPNIEAYDALNKHNELQIMGAFDGDKLIGYCLIVIRPHMHYCGTLVGMEDAYYLSKSYRKGLTGVRLLSKSIQPLKSKGVKKVFFFTKDFISIARILEYLGMERTDTVYSMWLED